MSINYHLYLTAIAKLTQTSPSDSGLLGILNDCIDYAELRCYRDLQLQRTITQDSSTALVAGSTAWSAPSAFIVVQSFNFVTPAGTQPNAGTLNPLRVVTTEFLDTIWPTRSVQAAPYNVPVWIAPITDLDFLICPTPDAAYVMSVQGTQRPTKLSPQNPTTVLTSILPDLFIAASMVFLSGWQKNFSSSGDDPNQSINWESEYKSIREGALVEENMKAFQSNGWTARAPAPEASQPWG